MEYNILFSELKQYRELYLEEFKEIISNESIPLPGKFNFDSQLVKIESYFKIFDQLINDFEKALHRVSPKNKIHFIHKKMGEIKDKYNCYSADEIPNLSLEILSYHILEENREYDLTYFAGHLVKVYKSAFTFGFLFENELLVIAKGVAQYRFMNALKSMCKKRTNTNSQMSDSIESFDAMFINPNVIAECILLLKETEPRVINDNNEYIGNNKGVIVVWYNALKSSKALRESLPNDRIITQLLNDKFRGLNLSKDGSMIRKPTVRAAKKYKPEFEKELLLVVNHSSIK